jgi:two-component system, LytTR family, sensor kinase
MSMRSATPDSTTRAFWILQLGGWAAYAVALMVPWLGRYSISVMWGNKLVIATTGLLTSAGLRIIYRRLNRNGAGIVTIALVAIVASITGAFIWNGVASAILGHSLQNDSILLGALGRTFPRFDGVLYHSLVLFTWSLLYLGARHYRELVAERERSLRAESLAREARLLALRYQIGPHFLFNALNAVSTLIIADRKTEATAMIARLADLLRASLQTPGDGKVSLRAELEIVRGYVDIERVRFGDRLDVTIDADEAALDALIPTMTLQPLVENAIRHAVAVRDGPTRIAVACTSIDARLTLSISDDGSGTAPTSNGLGVGLANVRSRLVEAYGSSHKFSCGPVEGGGYRAEIVLPRAMQPSAEPTAPRLEPQLA